MAGAEKKCCPMVEYMIILSIGIKIQIFFSPVRKQRGEESSQDMGANPIVQKWWDYMADIMEVNEDNSPVTIPLPEVFHMD